MVEALCPYFDNCGGCTSQHVSYEEQLEQKKKRIERLLGVSSLEVFSDVAYGYRNRMDFIIHLKGLGLREKGRWDCFVDIKECVIASPHVNALLQELRAFFVENDAFDFKKRGGTFRYAVVRCPGDDSSITFVLNKDSMKIGDAIEKIKEFSVKSSGKNILVAYVPSQSDVSFSDEFFVVKGKDVLEKEYLGKKFLFPAQGFFQNNDTVAEKMQIYCHSLFEKEDTQEGELLDLYSGVGTFGILNADLFKKVTFVESVASAVVCTKKNISFHHLLHCEAFCLDARYLKRLSFSKKLFVLTDPPRSGMHPSTLEALKSLKPRMIVYVSCNVVQLSKDISKFKEYYLEHVALFDLFPQTSHCEVVAVLKRKV